MPGVWKLGNRLEMGGDAAVLHMQRVQREVSGKIQPAHENGGQGGLSFDRPLVLRFLLRRILPADYLLAELRDEELLPRLERPNPHKSTWNNMMLYLRFQIEEYAFSPKKWGTPEALDAEFERRESDKKRRREAKFKTKLEDLKKRTRVDAYRRNRKGAAGGNFGDDMSGGRHVHQWGRSIENPETGIGVKKCVDCGMEVEELEF